MLQIVIILGWLVAFGLVIYLATQAIKHQLLADNRESWHSGKSGNLEDATILIRNGDGAVATRSITRLAVTMTLRTLIGNLIPVLSENHIRRMVETSLEAVALCGASLLSDAFAPVPSPSELDLSFPKIISGRIDGVPS